MLTIKQLLRLVQAGDYYTNFALYDVSQSFDLQLMTTKQQKSI